MSNEQQNEGEQMEEEEQYGGPGAPTPLGQLEVCDYRWGEEGGGGGGC